MSYFYFSCCQFGALERPYNLHPHWRLSQAGEGAMPNHSNSEDPALLSAY